MFQPGDHEKLDRYMGLDDTDHHLPTDLTSPVQQFGDMTIEYYAGAQGGLKPNVEFDKDKFAAYANTVTMAKLLLLQETLPNGQTPVGGQQPKTISKLLTDLSGHAYDFAAMQLNGDHGGNLLTATMPNVVDAYGQPVSQIAKYGQPATSDAWLTSVDSDHAFRQDAQTRSLELYRYHRTTGPDSSVAWRFPT